MTETAAEDIEAVRDTVVRFMQEPVVAVMDDHEKRGEFPRELIQRAGEIGLYGAAFPELVGGSNLGFLAAAVIQEEMARADPRFASCNNQQGSTCPMAIYAAGTPARAGSWWPAGSGRVAAMVAVGHLLITPPNGQGRAIIRTCHLAACR